MRPVDRALRPRLGALFASCIIATLLAAPVPSASGSILGQASPSPRWGMAMAYDDAHAEVVMFGGRRDLSDTWTWDGSAWTERHPRSSPSGRFTSMAYDAAHGDMVLFGGFGSHGFLGDTWTWDGSNWTEQHPPTSPSARAAPLAYDAARGEVVLFGGEGNGGPFDDTWTWDGSTWTMRHPATSPPARDGLMADDAARGDVVLFGEGDGPGILHDTWTWDGTNWTKRHPLDSPSARRAAAMTYDAGSGAVVLFGGDRGVPGGGDKSLRDTWRWDGTTWMKQSPDHAPTARLWAGVAYDAARGQVVVFGGLILPAYLPYADTWTWDGTDWHVPFAAHLHLNPASGPPNSVVKVRARGFAGREYVVVKFVYASGSKAFLGSFVTRADGRMFATVSIPSDATIGAQTITALGKTSDQKAAATFTVTSD